jgi:hydroxymethylpyrimidine pyrophosphatase-like HAD family hydrolase
MVGTIGKYVTVNINRVCIDVSPNKVNKASGIADLIALTGEDFEDVLVIGDGDNDVPMIKAYNGFAVPGSAPEAMAAATRVYDSVAEMLKGNL